MSGLDLGSIVKLPVAQTAMSTQAVSAGLGAKVFAAAMIGLGVIGFASGDFASVWQRIPIDDLPARSFFAYACAAVEFAAGCGLLFGSTAAIASRVLAAFILLWAVLLKLPGVVVMPQMEATWLGLAEVTVMLAGIWIVCLAREGSDWLRLPRFIAGTKGLRSARVLFALFLLPIGLAHFFYLEQTAALVPAWLPWHDGWAWLTGAGNVAASIAILSGYLPRLAAALETAMLAVITVLVWTPGLAPAPNGLQFQLTGWVISLGIAAGAWIVADSYRGARAH